MPEPLQQEREPEVPVSVEQSSADVPHSVRARSGPDQQTNGPSADTAVEAIRRATDSPPTLGIPTTGRIQRASTLTSADPARAHVATPPDQGGQGRIQRAATTKPAVAPPISKA
jgi:hypothetical protein